MADWTAVERCRKPPGYGKRHLLAILGFCGFALSYAMRFSLSIAIVAMVNNSGLQALRLETSAMGGNNTSQHSALRRDSSSPIIFKSDVCPHDNTPHEKMDLKLNLFHVQTIIVNSQNSQTNDSFPKLVINHANSSEAPQAFGFMRHEEEEVNQEPIYLEASNITHVVKAEKTTSDEDEGEFLWSEADQGIILGSFFWGYVLTQILGGWLSQRIGGKWPFGIGLLVTALLAIATPAAARYGGMNWLIFVRIVQGLAGGVTVPSMQAILSKWFPPEERGKLGSFTLAGMPFGTFMSTLCSGFLIHYCGWPSVFYVTGVMTLVWFLLWSYFAYADPEEDPTIDQAELRYIQTALNNGRKISRGDCQQAKGKLEVPWFSAWTSKGVWAILLVNTCETWGLYTINAELPTYMKTVLHFDIKQNSVMSAFPHLLTLIVSVILTNVGDFLIEHQYLSIVAVRKLSTSIAMWGPAAALFGVAYSGCDRVKTVALLATAIGLNGGKFGGFLVNIIDIAPNYAGVLMGIINTIASMPGFFAPWIAGMIINDNPSLENWRLVFLITAGVAFFGNLIYLLCASGEEQDWNRGRRRAEETTSSSFSMGTINQVILSNKTMKAQQNNKEDAENGHLYIIPLNPSDANTNEPRADPHVINVDFAREENLEDRQQIQPDDHVGGTPRCCA